MAATLSHSRTMWSATASVHRSVQQSASTSCMTSVKKSSTELVRCRPTRWSSPSTSSAVVQSTLSQLLLLLCTAAQLITAKPAARTRALRDKTHDAVHLLEHTYDLLIRHRSRELACDIIVVVSNHETLKPVADMFGIPFKHLPIPPKDAGGKRVQELQVEALLEEERIDLLVLARYMQILTPEFCAKFWTKTINIHHSFLPAFEGGRPYHRAHVRGVKIIGATAHYATADLDAGPIIEQDVTRISHSDSVSDMIRKGRVPTVDGIATLRRATIASYV
eukprot:7816-Heterococcus_DN1.PRE.2